MIFKSNIVVQNVEDQWGRGTNAGCSITLSAVAGRQRYLDTCTGFTDKVGGSVIEARTALTGTLSTTVGDATVTGTNTLFTTELEAGRLIRITDTSEYLTVLSITDATHFEATATSGSNEASSGAFMIAGRTSVDTANENFNWTPQGAVKSVAGQALTVVILESTAACFANGVGFTN